jgi:hypothetical protein
MSKKKRKTAGELSAKVFQDKTKYNALEVGHALADKIPDNVRECIQNHVNIINEPEFCVVMLIAEDPIIKNLMRRKFYCWPYLPSPRPNQAVWLYRKKNDSIQRLWVLPSAMVMAELTSLAIVHKKYQTMQAWSVAFYCGTFWEYIRHEHKIDMLSEKEYLAVHRDELIKAGCQIPNSNFAEPFDFSKISVKKVKDSVTPSVF